MIPDETVPLEKVYLNGVHLLLTFNKEDGVKSNEKQVYVDPDPDEGDMEDVRLDE